MKEIENMQFDRSNVLDFNIFLKDLDTTITSEAIFHGERDYEVFYKYGDYTYQDFADLITSGVKGFLPPQSAKIMKLDYETLAYVSPLRLGAASEPAGAVVIYTNTDEITELLQSLSDHFQGDAFIFDANGQMMAAAVENRSFGPRFLQTEAPSAGTKLISDDDGEYFVVNLKSDVSNWSFVAVAPKKALFAKAYYIQRLTVTIILVVLTLGGIAAGILAYRQSRPIRELLQTIRIQVDRAGIKQIFIAIKDAFAELRTNKQRLESILEEQTPLFYRVFFEKLISGGFKTAAEIETFAKRAGVECKAEHYVWILVQFEEHSEQITDKLLEKLNFNKFVVTNVMRDLLGGNSAAAEISEWRTAFLYRSMHGSAEQAEEELRRALEPFIGIVINKFQLTVKVVLSQPHAELLHSWKYYQQAQAVLDQAMVNRIVLASESDFSKDIFYPVEFELQLIHACKSGDHHALDRLFHVLHAENFEQRVLPASSYNLLLYEMKATLYKLDRSLLIDQSIEECTNLESVKQRFYQLCHDAVLRKKAQMSELVARMLQFIRARYDDPNLSLSMLSAEFSISESYVSMLVKEHTGNNFSAVLENIRIAKACEYLADSGLSIQEISRLTGYNSDKTFRRAFKRVTGIQPTAYREFEPEARNTIFQYDTILQK
jgi:YesN/AraC family two-component response regulator